MRLRHKPRAETTMQQRWLSPATLFAMVLMLTVSAHAEPLGCGIYLDADSGARLEVIDGERARIVRDGMAPSAQIHRRDGKTLRLYDIDEGYSPDDYTVSADGRTVTGVDAAFRKTFVLERATACASTPPAAPGTCAADIDACIASADLATDAMLQRYCDEGMPFACVKASTASDSARNIPKPTRAKTPHRRRNAAKARLRSRRRPAKPRSQNCWAARWPKPRLRCMPTMSRCRSPISTVCSRCARGTGRRKSVPRSRRNCGSADVTRRAAMRCASAAIAAAILKRANNWRRWRTCAMRSCWPCRRKHCPAVVT